VKKQEHDIPKKIQKLTEEKEKIDKYIQEQLETMTHTGWKLKMGI
jgi:hypothetical protein